MVGSRQKLEVPGKMVANLELAHKMVVKASEPEPKYRH